MKKKNNWLFSTPEKMKLNEESAGELYTKLKKYVDDKKIQLVGVTAHGVGAGHYKQILILKRELEDKIGVSIPIVNISMTDDFFAKMYAKLQKNSNLYHYFSKFYERLPGFLIDFSLKQKSKKMLSKEGLLKLGLDPNVETIFMSTYVMGSIAVAQVIEKGWKGKLVEYVPDPWLGNQLRSMTTTKLVKDHIVVVHSEETAIELIKMRKINPKNVFAWGTLSPKHTKKIKNDQYKSVLIEFSGNESLAYANKINEFVHSVADQIKAGKLKLTIHTMHHTATKLLVEAKLSELGIKNKVKVISARDLETAVESRLDAIAGVYGGTPDIRIGKGEVPIEHFDGVLVGAWGAGHEKRNARMGEEAGRGLNLIDVPVSKWWKNIEDFVKNSNKKKPPESWATLAPLLFMRKIQRKAVK